MPAGALALIGEAATLIAPYFAKPCDARAAVETFPAIVDFRRTMRREIADDSLDGLARLAAETVALIERVLAGREVWRYRAGDS